MMRQPNRNAIVQPSGGATPRMGKSVADDACGATAWAAPGPTGATLCTLGVVNESPPPNELKPVEPNPSVEPGDVERGVVRPDPNGWGLVSERRPVAATAA